MSEAPGPINFTMFLTMFGEKLNGTDPEDVIRNAFACFDEEASGRQPLDGGLDRAGPAHLPQGTPTYAGGTRPRLPPKARTETTRFCCQNHKSYATFLFSPPNARLKQPTSTKLSHFLVHLLAQHTRPLLSTLPDTKPFQALWPTRYRNQPPSSNLPKGFYVTAGVSQGQARAMLVVAASAVSQGPQAHPWPKCVRAFSCHHSPLPAWHILIPIFQIKQAKRG